MLPGRPEFRTVQALRGVACLLVVAYHAIDAWGAGQSPPTAADAIWPNGAAGVDMFFVISGFVMALSSAGLAGLVGARRFMVRRCRRLVPLYWLMTAAKLAVLGSLPAGMLAGQAFPGAWPIAASLLFLPARDAAGAIRPVLGVGWTLQFEMLFYALFALGLVLRRPPWRVVLPLLVPLAAAGFLRQPDWPAPLVLANGLVLEFALGMGVAAWIGGPATPGPRLSILLAAIGLAMVLTLPQPGPWRFAVWGLPAACVLLGAAGLERIAHGRLPMWLLRAGDASYAIYLLHPFIVPPLVHALSHLGGGLPVLIAASLAASTLGGVALHASVDRPLQAWLARAGQGRSTRPPAHFVQP